MTLTHCKKTTRKKPTRPSVCGVLHTGFRFGKRLCVLVAILAAGSVALAQEPAPAASETTGGTAGDELLLDRDQHLAAFDQVWETVRDSHWDAGLIDSVWIPLRDRYRERILKSDSRDAATLILQEMLSELKQSHFHVIPARVYLEMDKASEQGGEGWSGLTFRVIGDQFVVTHVAAESPAAGAGVEVGWVLERIQRPSKEKPLAVSELRALADEVGKFDTGRKETTLAQLAMNLTSGEIGQTVELTFLDNQDQSRQVAIALTKGPGQLAKLGNLPPTYVTFEYRRLPKGVGYIHFNAFLDAPRLIKEYQAALLDEHNANGVVIDVRGNIGGLIFLAMGMSGWFIDEPHSLGKMTQKGNNIKLSINPRKPGFNKPVAILVDECSVSCAELFPGGLQELKVARIFGSRTAGQLIPAAVAKLPTGDGFIYAMAGLESESGHVWEGNGVEPDEPIALTREWLQRDPDPVLSAALQWIADTAP